MYFIIRNCTLTNSSGNGLRLYFTNNGILFNNTCINNFRGIYLDESNNNDILGNFANNNTHAGISLIYSDYNDILGNFFSENDF